MLNIRSILKQVLGDLKNKPENIEIIDDMHFVDKISGVKFHLYDDYFQMTRGDESVTASSFSDMEQDVVMQIKNCITDPKVTQDKKDNYEKYLDESRQRFSSWFENPEPTPMCVVEEENVEEYVRQ